MKLSEFRQILSARGIQLTKSLGQNFLHDANQLRRIVAAAGLAPGDHVLEIGPGLGPLTEWLLAAGCDVLAIEKDARLAAVLRERLGGWLASFEPPNPLPKAAPASPPAWGVRTSKAAGDGGAPAHGKGTLSPGTLRGEQAVPDNAAGAETPTPALRTPGGSAGDDARPCLHLLHDDALALLRRSPRDWSGWKVVSNLPYSVASPILVELAQAAGPPERITATLQLEVARRLLAKPGTADYGLLTLLLQARYEPAGWFRISAGCFWPEPDVDSACVTLKRRTPALLPTGQAAAFERLVKLAFSQRRKVMLKLLKSAWPAPRLEAAFRELRLDPAARAETVALEQFVSLSQRLAASPSQPHAAHEAPTTAS